MLSSGEWVDVEFEVALDSGCTDNVCHPGDVPGYVVESPGSRCGQGFLVGNGERVPNAGQAHLCLQTGGPMINTITSTFQIADVTRPLMYVGDEGLIVEFAKERATVYDKSKRPVRVFERQPGGLYVAKVRLRSPSFAPQLS